MRKLSIYYCSLYLNNFLVTILWHLLSSGWKSLRICDSPIFLKSLRTKTLSSKVLKHWFLYYGTFWISGLKFPNSDSKCFKVFFNEISSSSGQEGRETVRLGNYMTIYKSRVDVRKSALLVWKCLLCWSPSWLPVAKGVSGIPVLLSLKTGNFGSLHVWSLPANACFHSSVWNLKTKTQVTESKVKEWENWRLKL